MSLEAEFFSGSATVVQGANRTYDRHSNLTAVLNHARSETGRDATGKVEHPSKTGSWLGNVAYLIMVDMLASIFYTLPPGGKKGNKAHFTGFLISRGILASDAEVFYELRCSLAHEFGLVNKPKRIFTVVANATDTMIVLPTNPVDLPFGSLKQEHVTVVNLQLVAQKLDDLVVSMKTEADSGTLHTVLPAAEFKDRFFFNVG